MNGNINTLKIYFGDPYPISDKIIFYQPKIQDIIDCNESEFWSLVYMFVGNSTYYKLWLWENGVDWNKISDYELFCQFVKSVPREKTEIMFGDIDFSGFYLYKIQNPPPGPEQELNPDGTPKKLSGVQKNKLKMKEFERTVTFYNPDQDVEISADVYHDLVEVMRETFKIKPKTEYTASKMTKELLIDEEKAKIKKAEVDRRNGKEESSSTLLPLISFCVNHPGFKYKASELKDVGIAEFMDSVRRLQLYESTRATLNGAYSGFADMSKVPKDQFDFTRPIEN